MSHLPFHSGMPRFVVFKPSYLPQRNLFPYRREGGQQLSESADRL
jgi:hypothetical protein